MVTVTTVTIQPFLLSKIQKYVYKFLMAASKLRL